MTPSRLITVRLHGPLGDDYGREHHFAVNSPREAVFALDANYPGFRRDFIRYQRYALLVDGVWLPPDTANKDPASAPASREIDIVPHIEGRGFLIAPVFIALGMSAFAAEIVGGLIVAALLVGVSMLLSPKTKKKPEAEESKKDESYIFSGPENVTEQGVAVPVAYGRLHVGSVVISAGLEVADTIVPPAATTASTGVGVPESGPPVVVMIEGAVSTDNVYGPAGWNYIGWGSDWSETAQGMVTGHVFVSPDGTQHYNSQTGQYYSGTATSLTEPRQQETPTCIDPMSRIRMADGLHKRAKDIVIGDEVVGLNGVNRVTRVDRVKLGTWRKLFRITVIGGPVLQHHAAAGNIGLLISGEHCMWTRADGDEYWGVNQLDAYDYERQVLGVPGDIPPLQREPRQISGPTEFAVLQPIDPTEEHPTGWQANVWQTLTPVEIADVSPDYELIEIGTDHSHSLIAECLMIGALVDDRDFAYSGVTWGP